MTIKRRQRLRICFTKGAGPMVLGLTAFIRIKEICAEKSLTVRGAIAEKTLRGGAVSDVMDDEVKWTDRSKS